MPLKAPLAASGVLRPALPATAPLTLPLTVLLMALLLVRRHPPDPGPLRSIATLPFVLSTFDIG
ncbi:MAG: hypothetical protein ACM3TT_03005 [Syntrophothermus sp.]